MATGREEFEFGAARRAGGVQVVLLVVAVAAILAAVWFFFVRDGESAGSPAPAGSAVSGPADHKKKEKKKDERPGEAGRKSHRKNKKDKEAAKVAAPAPAPVENFELFAPKDPFDPLVMASTAGTGGTGSSGSTDGASDSTGGHTVRLAALYQGAGGQERARVEVDDTDYRVGEGDVFATSFQLVAIENRCATMLFGDDQFSLCEGEEIVK